MYKPATILRGLLLSGILIPLLGGCGEDATESAATDGRKMPGVGSTFSTHVLFSEDSTSGEADFEVLVTASDMIVEGKERVVQYVADTLSTLICYELNGDISLYMKKGVIAGCEVEKTWLRFPFGSSQKVEETLVVTRTDLDGGPKECQALWSAEPAGEEMMTIDGQEYRAERSIAQFIVGEDQDATRRARRYEILYAPQIGYVVQEEILSLRGPLDAPDTIGTSRRELREYRLR